MSGHGRRGMTLAGLVVLGALLAVGCSSGGDTSDGRTVTSEATTAGTGASIETTPSTLDPTCVGGADVAKGTTTHTVVADGVPRTYLQHVPTSYEGVSMPVVLAFHGFAGTAA